MKWSKLPSALLTRKIGCRMVHFGKNKLAAFGGYGPPPSSIQPGASFTRSSLYTDGRGWNNEFHIFNLDTGVWSSPDMTGPRPPPCAGFSFTSVSENRAVVFGGRQSQGRVNDLYIIDFTTMHWTKIEQGVGEPWPEGRAGHAACCLDHGGEHPQILITGGLNKDFKVLNDAWLFSVSFRKWKKLTLPDVTLQPRIYHSTTAVTLTNRLVEVIMFGGCPEWKTYYDLPRISETTIMKLESIEHPSSNGGPSTREWVLVDVATNSQRGTSEKKVMKISTKSKEVVNRQVQQLHVTTQTDSNHQDDSNSRTLTFKMDRRFNVVVYGIPEVTAQCSRESRLQTDLSNVTALIRSIDDSIPALSFKECHRLGRYKTVDSHPRPLLVRLNKKSEVKSILSNRGKFHQPYFIKPDMTHEEVTAERLLMQERWSLIQSGVEKKDIKISKDSLHVKGQLHANVINSKLVLSH